MSVEWLVEITESLLYPVIVALVGLGLWALLQSGSALREGLDRRRGRRWLRSRADSGSEALGDEELAGLELLAEQRLAPLRTGMRLGPVFGLMGTLIPLAPGLRAMATGQLDVLASELQIAFATTVLGLGVGAVFHVLQAARRQWYQRDLHELAIRGGGSSA